jgi:hypothetical protein
MRERMRRGRPRFADMHELSVTDGRRRAIRFRGSESGRDRPGQGKDAPDARGLGDVEAMALEIRDDRGLVRGEASCRLKNSAAKPV